MVNVASACGFTDSHYKGLIRMKNVLSVNDKFEVLAFPCNQFGGQEPEVSVLLSCQPRVTVTSCFVYKVIRDLESVDHLCIRAA